MHFTNAFLLSDSKNPLRLAETTTDAKWGSARDIRRSLERWQTKTFVHELMVSTGAGSVYALEELMMSGLPALSFPGDRPKICDRMVRYGEPAIVKQFGQGGKKDLRTQRWFEKLLALSPNAANVLLYPLWPLLDPRPLTYVEWHALGVQHVKEAVRVGPLQKAWMVAVPADSPEDEPLHFIPCVGDRPTRFDLTTLLLGLRRAEIRGDLVAYDLFLQEVLNTTQCSVAHASLQTLQPEAANYISQVYGDVCVPYGSENREAQWVRVQTARDAWSRRVLIDKNNE